MGVTDKFRRTHTGALVSVDKEGLAAYRQKKRQMSELNRVIREHDELKKDMADIKSMLGEILGKIK